MRSTQKVAVWLVGVAIALSMVACAGHAQRGVGMAPVYPHPGVVASSSNPLMQTARKHSTAASLAAGYVAYKVAKNTGRNRAMMGEKKNWAQRHPVVTGVAAAVITHHMLRR